MNTAIQDPAPTLSDVWRLFRETDRRFFLAPTLQRGSVDRVALAARWVIHEVSTGFGDLAPLPRNKGMA